MERIHNFEQTEGVFVIPPYALVAAAGTDNVKLTSPSIDRDTFGELDLYAVITATIRAVAEGATLTLTLKDSENDSTYATFATKTIAIASTTATETLNLIKAMKINLSDAKQYLKLESTLNLVATGTDTAVYSIIGILACPSAAPTAQVDQEVTYS